MSDAPFDPTSEQIVIAAALVDDEALDRLIRTVKPDDCYAERHRVIWTVLRELRAEGLAYDLATFASVATDLDFVEREYGGDDYLRGLVDAYPDGANLDWHLRRSRIEARLRTAADERGEELVEAMRTPGVDPEEVASIARGILNSATRLAADTGSLAATGAVAAETYRDLLARRRSGSSEHVPTGLPELDDVLTWGFAGGRVTVLAGRPSNGKTSFTYNLAKWWVDRCERTAADPRPILWVPLEMGSTSTQDGLVARTSRTDSTRLIRHFGALSIGEQAEVASAVKRYVETPWIDWFDEAGASIDRVESVLASALEHDPAAPKYDPDKVRSRYGLVIWDLFDRSIQGELSPANMSKALGHAQNLAKRYGTHLLLVAQIKRGIERRGDKRPTREDVKGTGGWEEVADQLLAVHRERVYDPDLEEDTMEIGVLKQRMGPFGMWLSYRYDAATFYVGEFEGSSQE